MRVIIGMGGERSERWGSAWRIVKLAPPIWVALVSHDKDSEKDTGCGLC